MTIEGTVKLIGEIQTFGDNGFRKRELVVVMDGKYPQAILVEFLQDKCDLLNNYIEGQNVKVSINLRGLEWLDPKTNTTRYFNSIQGWRIEAIEGVETAVNSTPLTGDDNDDLPF